MTDCSTLDEVRAVMKEKGGFARIPFVSMGMDGKEGDKIVHDQTGGEARSCFFCFCVCVCILLSFQR